MKKYILFTIIQVLFTIIQIKIQYNLQFSHFLIN